MEIANISGADTIPKGFSTEAPRQEETRKTESPPVNQSTGTSDNSKGTTIDTYA
jgi:hypothetical protein